MARKKFDVVERLFMFDGLATDAATDRVEGFLGVEAGNATVAMGVEGVVLTCTTEADSLALLKRSDTGVIPLGDVIGCEFFFEMNAMSGDTATTTYLGLLYDGTDPTAATAKCLAKFSNLAGGVDAHDGTTAYTETGIQSVVAGTWYTLNIDLNYEVLTQSPPSLSKGHVAKFSLTDASGYTRKWDTGTTTIDLSAASATRVAPFLAITDVTAGSETPNLICRYIKWKYRI